MTGVLAALLIPTILASGSASDKSTITLRSGAVLSGRRSCYQPGVVVCIIDSAGAEHIVPWASLAAKAGGTNAERAGRTFRPGAKRESMLPRTVKLRDVHLPRMMATGVIGNTYGVTKVANASGAVLRFESGAYVLWEFSEPTLRASRRSGLSLHAMAPFGVRVLSQHSTEEAGGATITRNTDRSTAFFSPGLEAGYQFTFWSAVDSTLLQQRGIGLELSGATGWEFRTVAEDGVSIGAQVRLHVLKRSMDGRLWDTSIEMGVRNVGEFTDYTLGWGIAL